MLEWIKKSRVVYVFIASVVISIFNVGVYSAAIPKQRAFDLHEKRVEALEERAGRVEERINGADRDVADIRVRLGRMEELIIGIAVQVGAPTKVGK